MNEFTPTPNMIPVPIPVPTPTNVSIPTTPIPPIKKTSPLLYLVLVLLLFLTIALGELGYIYFYNKNMVLTSSPVYGCSPDGKCLLYPIHDLNTLCHVVFTNSDCDYQCDNPVNFCAQ